MPDQTGLITSKQMRELHALLRDHGISGDATVHAYLDSWLSEHGDEQYPLESRTGLAGPTATKIIRELRGADVEHAPGGLARALVAVQAALPVVGKNKTARIPGKNGGTGYSYSYADLGDVTAAAMPLLTANGLAFSCCPRAAERGYELVGVLLHVSGEAREGALPLHGNDPQAIGGALTYMRRYLLGSMIGLVTDEDADGQQAMGAAPTRQWDGPSTADLLNAIDADAQRAGVEYGTATAKFREQRGGMTLDDLDTLDPWHLTELAAAVKKRADEVVAATQAAETPAETPAAPAAGEAAADPWAAK